ncbi:MAG: hypothetical protein ABEJ59_04065 [Halanaeroarchaeum sp.]
MYRGGRRGQSQTVGVVLVLALTVISAGAIAMMGGTAIDRTQQTVAVQSAEHALSQLDSEVSLVALSRADRQSVALGGRDGTLTVFPDRGHITVTHLNYTEYGDDEVIYDATLGEVRYEVGDQVIGYQGGGVWRSAGGNGSTMVSAPEFHYRGQTLTLPVIRLRGNDSVAGPVTADVSDGSGGRSVYPDETRTYTNTSRTFRNPVQNGTLRVTIQSEFYRGWAAYFRERTDGDVTTFDGNQTAQVDLISPGMQGTFQMPFDGDPISLRGTGNGHPLGEFQVRILPDQPESQTFSGLKWSLWAQRGNQQFEFNIRANGNPGDNDTVAATVYYSNGTADQVWHNDSAYTVRYTDIDGDGTPEYHLDVDLTGNASFTYGSGGNDLIQFSVNNTVPDPVTFDEHPQVSWEPHTFAVGDRTTVGNVTNHYVGLYSASVDLHVKDGNANTQGVGNNAGNINERISSGYLEYNSTGNYVNFLYVSENNVTVDLR